MMMMVSYDQLLRLSSLSLLFLLSHTRTCSCKEESRLRIAVIGGGISGSFVTKYLMEFDNTTCAIDEITILDSMPELGASAEREASSKEWQESRVSAIHLSHPNGGTMTVELGASIIYKGFQYVMEMINGDESLEMVEPFATGSDSLDDADNRPTGMGIYNGEHDFAILTSGKTPSETKSMLMKRYHVDLYLMDRATTIAEEAFDRLHDMLDDPTRKAFSSPKQMWQAIDLWQDYVTKSLETVCDDLGMLHQNGTMSSWKSMPQWVVQKLVQGIFGVDSEASLRAELLTSINLVNYHQDTTQINGIAGLGSFSATKGGIFSIAGGNSQIIHSAIEQAKKHRQQICQQKSHVISHKVERISTVIGSEEGFEVYGGDSGELVGVYELVILAAPLAMARIQFLIHSHVDHAVLMPMPMGELIVHADSDGNSKIPNDQSHEGFGVLPNPLPKGARRPYTQVVTTIVQNGQLQASQFGLTQDQLPRSILMTAEGKKADHDIVSISWITEGTYKLFSSNPLSITILQQYFGPSVEIAVEKVWGGQYGGATPDHRGTATSVGFVLYDGAEGLEGHTQAGALYYPNAMELTFACMELSAVGAKAVAKLIAERFEWIRTESESDKLGEEL